MNEQFLNVIARLEVESLNTEQQIALLKTMGKKCAEIQVALIANDPKIEKTLNDDNFFM